MAERKVSIPITADGKQAQSVIEKVSDSLAKRCITFHFQKVVQHFFSARPSKKRETLLPDFSARALTSSISSG